jgi:hypothetical protein
MENGFYRCSQPEVSVNDWISLNFGRFQAGILRLIAENRPETYEDLARIDSTGPEEPEEPCPYDQDDEPSRAEFDTDDEFDEALSEWKEGFEEYREYLAAYAKWEEEHEEWEQSQQLMSWPVAWNTMWSATDSADLIGALIDSGFVVYRTQGELEDFGPIVFGVDGCGYGFYGAHWIPLRARLARIRYDKGYGNGRELAALLDSLVPLVKREGDDPKRFLVEYGSGVVEMGTLECVMGWELHDKLGLDAQAAADAIQHDKEMDEGLHQ